MKQFFFVSIVVCALLIACSPKGGKTTAATIPAVNPMEAQLAAAKTKYPDATTDQLKKGTLVYYGEACTRCHNAKEITNFSAEELPGIIDNMARKAKISAEEKDAVLKYVMGVRLASK
jgi:cytochrome c2